MWCLYARKICYYLQVYFVHFCRTKFMTFMDMGLYLGLDNDCFKILNSIPLHRPQSLILLLVFFSDCIATRQHAKFKALRTQARSEAVLVVQE